MLNTNAEVQIIVSGNAIPIFKTNIKPSDGEVLFETSNNAQKYEIWYTVMSTSSTDGMRINCWLY